MSWSVSSSGKVEDVKAKIAEQFENSATCDEPEESIKQEAAELIDLALGAQGFYPNVNVSAYGSMSKDAATGAVANSLSISITPSS